VVVSGELLQSNIVETLEEDITSYNTIYLPDSEKYGLTNGDVTFPQCKKVL